MQSNWQQQQQYPYSASGFGGAPGFQPGAGGPGQGGLGGAPSFLSSQPTGFPMQQPPQQQPMQTGFGQQQQRPQPTGMQGGGPGGNYSFLNAPPPSNQSQFGQHPMQSSFTGSSGITPQMTGFPGGGASGLMSQQTGYPGGGGGLMSQPTGMGMGMGMGGGGLMAQPTGMGGLRPQPTGFHDPRLQTMMQSFMPSNLSQPFAASGAPQFNPAQQHQPLQQTFQSLLQNPQVKTPKVPWTLSRQEKKDYDQIFRAWDVKGDGFISGETAIEVFGQSGLGQEDLMKIWNLSDVDNRGKLNLPEFHVAMGLIYRALNGNEIPDKLPEELVPASMRDIDTTVNFMRDLLKHESSTRSNASSPSYGGTPVPSAAASKDATMYKHTETGGAYKPSSRHLDRKSVRYAGEDSGAEIGDLRRQLANTSMMLDKSAEDYARKSDEDEALEQEVDDLKYKVRRIQQDIEYVSKGRRSAEKDEERRKLERELLYLMHEKLPELERRQKQREDERRMEERAGVRARDRRNDSHGRYDDRDRQGDDRDWLRGTYDRDRDRDRDRDYYSRDRDNRDRDYDRYDSRDRSRERERDRERDRDYRPRSPPATRTPPPAPPATAPSTISAPPPAPPAPASQAAAAPSTKNMTPEERTAFIRAQAQKRIQDRLRALGVESTTSEQPTMDTSVQDRLEQEKKEAEEKSKSAEKEQEAREEARRKRLGLEGGGGSAAPTSASDKPAAPVAPTPPGGIKSAMKKPPAPPPQPPVSRSKGGPPPAPVSRGPAPVAPPVSKPAAPAPAPVEDPEEVELRQREEARQKAIAERRTRLAQLEKEEEEERQREEALIAARKNRSPAAQSPAASAAPLSPSGPPAPPAPAEGGPTSYNPFRKPNGSAATSSPAAPSGSGGFNPFFKQPPTTAPPVDRSPAEETPSQPATEAPPAPPPAPPAPPPAPPAPFMPPAKPFSPPPADDEWEQIHEKSGDEDSSDDEDYAHSRAKRAGLASALFGNTMSPTGSRPGSAGPTPKTTTPPAALGKLGGGDPNAGRGALLSAIQGGARLKKAQTVEKGQGVTGRIIGGDAAPPPHIANPPRIESPEPQPSAAVDEERETSFNPNRQSVDWYAGLAADTTHPGASFAESTTLGPTREEEEVSPSQNGHTPAITIEGDGGDELDEFDMARDIRIRTLYAYEGQREVDLSFKENVVIIAHPAKDSSSPWWYGTVVDGGKSGWFPHTYVEEMKVQHAKALYTYEGGDDEQLPFAEGDELAIVDSSDPDWWKTEKAGVIFIVPASYLELTG